MPKLPDYARLAFECPMRWEKMARLARGEAPNGQPGEKRFCGQCREQVHDLSAMTRAQAERFVAETGGRACVSFEFREDEGVVHLPEIPLWAGVVAIGMAACGSPELPPGEAVPAAPVRAASASPDQDGKTGTEGTEGCGESDGTEAQVGGGEPVPSPPKRRLAGKPVYRPPPQPAPVAEPALRSK